MRITISRSAAVLAAVLTIPALVIAACGSQRAATPGSDSTTPPVSGQNGPATFVDRARQVSDLWDRSAAARAWRTGLVLINTSDLTTIPPSAAFSSSRDKIAFESGHFRLAGTLPATPLPGVVRWADGTTLRLPLLTARAAFGELATQRSCGDPAACGQLTVTGAQPGVVTVATSRGLASVPAWNFTVAGLDWKVSEVAVARSALVVLPGDSASAAGSIPPGVGGLTAVSADGRTLTLSFYGGACVTAWGAYLYESGNTVVVGSWEKPRPGNAPCPAYAVPRTARVTLTRPLGTRLVLDVASGRPLLTGVHVP